MDRFSGGTSLGRSIAFGLAVLGLLISPSIPRWREPVDEVAFSYGSMAPTYAMVRYVPGMHDATVLLRVDYSWRGGPARYLLQIGEPWSLSWDLELEGTEKIDDFMTLSVDLDSSEPMTRDRAWQLLTAIRLDMYKESTLVHTQDFSYLVNEVPVERVPPLRPAFIQVIDQAWWFWVSSLLASRSEKVR